MNIIIFISILFLFILLLSISIAANYIGKRLTGYSAKNACSLINITKLSLEEIKKEISEDFWLLKYVSFMYDKNSGSVVCKLFGLFKRTAIYRPPLGSVLLYPKYKKKYKKIKLR